MFSPNRENSPLSLGERYQARVAAGDLRPDKAQAETVGLLESLALQIKGYRIKGGLLPFRKSKPAPRGLYLFGDVGRGKSMLMDLFFEAADVGQKRRVHFHQFMLEVHERLHRLQTDQADNVLPSLARDLAKETALICFDEFHVGNIADAMILSRLFSALFDAGVVVVATSNWPPDELYKNGLQRDRFLPFIDLLKERMNVHRLTGAIDHRFEKMRAIESYFHPLGIEVTARLQKIFAQLTDGAKGEAMQLPVKGRTIAVPRAAKGVAFLTFEEICGQPYGAADYLAIAQCFHTVLIDRVPELQSDERNETVRFMTLIDALYEAKVRLYIAAAVAPEKICTAGEHVFAFQRTASRLTEMQGEEYRQTAHLG